MFIVALLTTAKIWNQPKCESTDEWIKIIHTHTHTGISFSFFRSFVTTGMNLGDILSET